MGKGSWLGIGLGLSLLACDAPVKTAAPSVATQEPMLEQRVAKAVETYDNSRGQYGYIAVTGEVYWARSDGKMFLMSTNYGGMKVSLGCEGPNGPQPGPYTTLAEIAQELRPGRTVEVAVPRHNIPLLGYDQALDSICPGAVRFDVEHVRVIGENWREEALRGEREHDERLAIDPRLD